MKRKLKARIFLKSGSSFDVECVKLNWTYSREAGNQRFTKLEWEDAKPDLGGVPVNNIEAIIEL